MKRAELNAFLSTEPTRPISAEWLEGETRRCGIKMEAWKAVISYPVPNHAILLEKMDMVMEKYGEADQDDFNAVHAAMSGDWQGGHWTDHCGRLSHFFVSRALAGPVDILIPANFILSNRQGI
ncbi:MAG: hypothetical protein IPG62_14365 [Sphingomonadales bacterium]|nr:hypothetical protein [Sphingomonadales bacterium]